VISCPINFYLEYAKLPTQQPPYEREKFWEAAGTPFFDIWPRYLENGERPLADIVTDATAQGQAARCFRNAAEEL
jgi:hypothetical protein